MTFAGHNLIAENGSLLAEAAPFAGGDAVTELDLGRMVQERQRNTTFMPEPHGYTTVEFELPPVELALTRPVSPTPFVPQDAAARAERCELILRIQAEGLAKRMEHTHAKCGRAGHLRRSGQLSGLAGGRARLKVLRPRREGHCGPYDALLRHDEAHPLQRRNSVRGAGRTVRARSTSPNTVKQPLCRHRPARRPYDVTFENCQARVRTLELMDYANKNGGFVIGTGDLSELALGWATYNGDHMSMYGVNAGVPKTLVRHIVQYVADTCGKATLRDVLLDILDTPVSPELLPTAADGTIAQQTENLVGPYELHDFYLYYVLRFGFGPEKIYRLAPHRLCTGKYPAETLLALAEELLPPLLHASSSSAAVCPTARRSARSRSPPAETGACPATPAIRCGWQN